MMTTPSSLTTLMTAALLSFSVSAWAAGAAEQHSTHSGQGHAASSGESSTAHPANSMGMGSDMMAMCDKMMNAKSPQERKAMMDEHMKSMPADMQKNCIDMMKQHKASKGSAQ